MKTPMWFTIGKTRRHTDKLSSSIKTEFVGRIKRIKLVRKSQIVPVMTAACTASVDKNIVFSIEKDWSTTHTTNVLPLRWEAGFCSGRGS